MKRRDRTLFQQQEVLDFYEDRYEHGYMEEWPIEKKRKILEIISELPLPARGEALDFGCGNGVVTEILRQALPSWTIYGADLSHKAIANARERYSGIKFFATGDSAFSNRKFDLVFTHHVLEHVPDLNQVLDELNQYLKPESSMLHFLPCANEGSFEREISLLREDGIDRDAGNRYFFEDKGHLRRLNTDQFRELCSKFDFELKKEFYSNQYHGAINWITTTSPGFVMMITNSATAVDDEARKKLKEIRRFLILRTALRLPAQMVKKVLKKRHRTLKHYALLVGALPLFVFSYPFDKFYRFKAVQEWNERKNDPNGSEMCLYSERKTKLG